MASVGPHTAGIGGAGLLAVLRRELVRAGTPERAAGAQAYMKSAMPFHGVRLKNVR